LTGNLILDLAVSLAGVVVIVAITYVLGAFKSATVSVAAAADRLAFDEPDFKVGDWLVGVDGKSAAAVSADGAETALVFAVGDCLATRRFRKGAIGLEKDGAGIAFRLGEPSRRVIRLAAADPAAAEQWLLRLAGLRL
jgi:hypothetical protein